MHLPPVVAETIFHIGNMPITNSMINTWVAAIILITIAFLIKRNVREVPKGLQNIAESIIEIMFKYGDQVTGSREKTRKFLPLAGTLFIFILLSNWMGLLPGVGSIGVWQEHSGELALVPLFRPATSDINMTIAMSVIGVMVANVMGIFAIGFFKHLGKFINFGGVVRGLKRKGIKDKLIYTFVGIIDIGVGLIETVSEAAKVVSLSFRLFGNIFAGEVLLGVMLGLFAYVLPLPFMFLEIIVGIVQALVFAMLVLVYAAMATTEPHHE